MSAHVCAHIQNGALQFIVIHKNTVLWTPLIPLICLYLHLIEIWLLWRWHIFSNTKPPWISLSHGLLFLTKHAFYIFILCDFALSCSNYSTKNAGNKTFQYNQSFCSQRISVVLAFLSILNEQFTQTWISVCRQSVAVKKYCEKYMCSSPDRY